MSNGPPVFEQSEWTSWLIKYQLGLASKHEERSACAVASSPSTSPQCSLGDMMVRDLQGRLVSSLDFFLKEGYLASPPALLQHRKLRDLALLRHNLDQSFGNSMLDAHCRQTKALFRAQFSAISLAQVDPEFMQIMGATGSGLEEIVKVPLPRSSSLCSHAFLLGERTAVIPNRSKDWRLRKFAFGPHPDYHQQPPLGFNFYASAAVMLTAPNLDYEDDGSPRPDVKVQVGRLCVLDFDAREDFGEVEVAQLEAMASMASDSVQREWESRRASKLMSMQLNINRLTSAFHSKFLSTTTSASDEIDEEAMEKKMNDDMQSLFQLSCEQMREQFGAAGVICFGPPFPQSTLSSEGEAVKRRESLSKEEASKRDSLTEKLINNDMLRRNSLLTQGSSIPEVKGQSVRRRGKSRICICAKAGINSNSDFDLSEEKEDAIENWIDRYADPTRLHQQKVVTYRSKSLRRAHATRYQDDVPDKRDMKAEELACLIHDQDTANFIMAPIMTLDKRQTSYVILIHWSKETLFEEWDRTFLLSSTSILQSACIRKNAIESDKARLKFMRLVSHELRTPLHGIIGMSSQLQHCLDGEGSHIEASRSSKVPVVVDGEAIWLSKSIQCAGEDLQKMLDDMLICGRVSVGLPSMTSESVARRDTRLMQLIENSCQKQLVASMIRRNQVDLSSNTTSSNTTLPLIIVRLDIESELIRLNQYIDKAEIALDQFISNALRFCKSATEEKDSALVEISIGPVREEGGAVSTIEQQGSKASLKITRESKDDENSRDTSAKVQVTIQDNGIGMSETFLEHFAEPFKKANEFQQGAGVGAAVGISSLNELGGTVSVSSILGQGTTIKMIIKGELLEEEITKEIIPRGERLTCAVLSTITNDSVKRYLEEQFALLYVKMEIRKDRFSIAAIMLYYLDSISEDSLQVLNKAYSSLRDDQRMIVATILIQTEIAELQQTRRISSNPNVFYLTNPWVPSALQPLEAFLEETRFGKSNNQSNQSHKPTSSPTTQRHYTEISLSASTSGSKERLQEIDDTTSASPSIVATTNMSTSHQTRRPSTAPPAIMADNSTVSLPSKSNLPPLRQISSPANSTHSLSQADDSFSVLLVEDNPINMRLLEACVKKIKCRYFKAFDGIEAVNRYKEMSSFGPSVVLLDISLPFMDGYQACKQMRAFSAEMKSNQRAHIIAITALSSEEDVQRGLECGVDEWRVKPANLPKLTIDLKNWQKKWQERKP